MEGMRIAAGIVLYNPGSVRLEQNLTAIRTQVDILYIVDNASSNWSSIEPLVHDAVVIRNTTNQGIAHALNQLLQMGERDGMQWVLTLDQDSICPPDLIEKLAHQANNHPQAGIVCPVIHDRSFGIEHQPTTDSVTPVNECITSASLTKVAAWSEVGGFDDWLFIDAVDTDFCLSLHEQNWQVLRVNAIQLNHEIGHNATLHRIGNRSYIAFNHAPIRYYYMARNMVYLSRKHKGFLQPAPWRCMLTMIARMGVILLWEKEQRWIKCGKIIKGLSDGIKKIVCQK